MDPSTVRLHAGVPARGVKVSGTATVSVVLTSAGERKKLESCLENLLPRCNSLGAHVTVVRACAAEEIEELRDRYGSIDFVAAEQDTPHTRMRVMGMARADGDIVLFQSGEAPPADWPAPRFLITPRTEDGVE